jgi:hypothetical protein
MRAQGGDRNVAGIVVVRLSWRFVLRAAFNTCIENPVCAASCCLSESESLALIIDQQTAGVIQVQSPWWADYY